MWDVFKDWIFDIIHFFYDFCGDWGLAIIIVTVIFRILISPLMHKQTKSSFQMQKVQPLMQELQRKYADDQPRLQEEMQKLYAEVKFNPLAGCLPMLLQMPIFMALFQVLSEMGSRTSGTTYEFYNLVPSLVMRPSEALAVGFGTFDPYGDLRGRHVFAHGSHADGKQGQPAAQADHDHGRCDERVHALDQLELARRRASVLGRVLPHGHCAAADLHAHHEEARRRGR